MCTIRELSNSIREFFNWIGEISNWIRELSYSIKEISYSIRELSNWIGGLSNSNIFPYCRGVARIRESSLIQLQSTANELVRSLIVYI